MTTAPNHERTPEKAELLTHLLACDVPLARAAESLSICERTIRRHYGDVIRSLDIKRGQKAYRPSAPQQNTVQQMAAIGIPQDEIARFLGISTPTLAKHFADALRVGSTAANLAVGESLYRMATGDPNQKSTVVAAIWWSKVRMGWKDTSRIESTGINGGPIQTENQVIVVLPDNGRGET